MLAIMEVGSDEFVAQFDTPPDQRVGEFYWANDERILFSTVIMLGGLDIPLFTGEIFALNIDGTRKFKVAGPVGFRDRVFYGISNMLMEDAGHIRVVGEGMMILGWLPTRERENSPSEARYSSGRRERKS